MTIPATRCIRCLAFFNDKRLEWSEEYWTPEGVLIDNALASFSDLIFLRSQCLGAGVEITELRVSEDDIFRDSLIDTSFANWGHGGNPAKKIYNQGLLNCGPAADPWDVLKLRQEAGPLYRRIVYMSGYPEAIEVDQGNYDPRTVGSCKGFADAFNAFVNGLVAGVGGWGFPAIVKPATVQANVVDVQSNAQGGIDVKYDGPDGVFPLNRTVQLRNVRMASGSVKVQGQKTVVAKPMTNVVSLQPIYPGLVKYSRAGTIELVTRSFHSITKVIPDGFTIHKRGVASLGFRGRLRNRRNFVG